MSRGDWDAAKKLNALGEAGEVGKMKYEVVVVYAIKNTRIQDDEDADADMRSN